MLVRTDWDRVNRLGNRSLGTWKGNLGSFSRTKNTSGWFTCVSGSSLSRHMKLGHQGSRALALGLGGMIDLSRLKCEKRCHVLLRSKDSIPHMRPPCTLLPALRWWCAECCRAHWPPGVEGEGNHKEAESSGGVGGGYTRGSPTRCLKMSTSAHLGLNLTVSRGLFVQSQAPSRWSPGCILARNSQPGSGRQWVPSKDRGGA